MNYLDVESLDSGCISLQPNGRDPVGDDQR